MNRMRSFAKTLSEVKQEKPNRAKIMKKSPIRRSSAFQKCVGIMRTGSGTLQCRFFHVSRVAARRTHVTSRNKKPQMIANRIEMA